VSAIIRTIGRHPDNRAVDLIEQRRHPGRIVGVLIRQGLRHDHASGSIDPDAAFATSGAIGHHVSPQPLTRSADLLSERFNKTILAEFYQAALRKKIHRSIEELQADLDVWIRDYITVRTHPGRWCYGKTPMQTFIDTLPVAKEKLLQAA
jgi:hypothetical protein